MSFLNRSQVDIHDCRVALVMTQCKGVKVVECPSMTNTNLNLPLDDDDDDPTRIFGLRVAGKCSDEWHPLDADEPTYRYGRLVTGKCRNCDGEGTAWEIDEEGLPPGDYFSWEETCKNCKGVGYATADFPDDLAGWTFQQCEACNGDGAVICYSSISSAPVEAWYAPCKSCGGRREILMPPTEMNGGDQSDHEDAPF